MRTKKPVKHDEYWGEAAQSYVVGYRCTECGRIHAEYGQLTAVSPRRNGHSAIKASDDDIIALVQKEAAEAVEKSLAELCSQVNAENTDQYLEIHVSGKCSSCGADQPWGSVYRQKWYDRYEKAEEIRSAEKKAKLFSNGNWKALVLFFLLCTAFSFLASQFDGSRISSFLWISYAAPIAVWLAIRKPAKKYADMRDALYAERNAVLNRMMRQFAAEYPDCTPRMTNGNIDFEDFDDERIQIIDGFRAEAPKTEYKFYDEPSGD